MSPASGTREPGNGGRAALGVAAVALVALALALLARATPRAEFLDPNSGSPSGARALRLLLGDLGARVTTGADVPEPGSVDRLVVLVDRLSTSQRTQVTAFAAAGGVVIDADPDSPLLPDRPAAEPDPVTSDVAQGSPIDSPVERGTCGIAALDRVRSLVLTVIVNKAEVYADAAGRTRRFSVPDGAAACFTDGTQAFVIAEPVGQGTLVGLGSNWMVSNALLTRGDNAPLAAALMAPNAGTRVHLLRGTGQSSAARLGGDRRLLDLVRPSVWMGLVLALVAFVLVAWSRAVRVGRPVVEQPPVPIAGAALVSAAGNLMHRAGHHERAAELLRYRAHRDLCRSFGIGVTEPVERLDAAVARRAHTEPGRVLAALGAPDVPLDLAAYAEVIRQLREETL